MRRTVPFALLLIAASSFSEEAGNDKAAKFVATGAAVALKHCDLPARRCNDKPLVVKNVVHGESNDEKRSVETLTQPGLEAEVVFVFPKRHPYYIGALTLTDAKWQSTGGLRVGWNRVAVLSLLGEPRSTSGDACDYYFNEPVQGQLSICYKNDLVRQMRWEYFVD